MPQSTACNLLQSKKHGACGLNYYMCVHLPHHRVTKKTLSLTLKQLTLFDVHFTVKELSAYWSQKKRALHLQMWMSLLAKEDEDENFLLLEIQHVKFPSPCAQSLALSVPCLSRSVPQQEVPYQFVAPVAPSVQPSPVQCLHSAVPITHPSLHSFSHRALRHPNLIAAALWMYTLPINPAWL
jgi:hypothetical protein